jgi:hypothetical protein
MDEAERTLAQTQRYWPDPKKGPWYVELYWMEQDGAMVPYGMTLLSGRRPSEPAGSLLNAVEMVAVTDPETGEPTGARDSTGRFKEVVKRRKLTGEDLRELRFGDLVHTIASDHAEFSEYRAQREELRRGVLEQRAKHFAKGAKRKGGRPRQWTDADLAEIGRVYEAGGDRPIQAVLRWYFTKTGKRVDETTASQWAWQAEDAGLLVRRKRRSSGAGRRPKAEETN